MKNNKGFTLIELLSVIVILSLLMSIAVPAALSVSKKVKAKTYSNKISLAEKSAALWATDNKSCLKAIAAKSLPTDDGTNSISNIDGCNGVVNNCKISKDDTNMIECTTTMGTLADMDYFKYDKEEESQKIITDPRDNKSSLNKTPIIINFNKNGDSINISPIEITTIKRTPITVNLCGCRSTYNGKEQTCSEDLCAVKSTTNTELSKDYTITFSSTISGTNTGTYKRPYSGVTIKNGTKDVTNRYDITYGGGEFYIDKKEIQVTANSCSFIRNNQPQTCSGAFVNNGYTLLSTDALNITDCCKVIGTAVNSYVNPINGIAIKNNSTNSDNTSNYNISKKTNGTLTIKNPELKTITVSNDNNPSSYVNSTATVSSVTEIVSVSTSYGSTNIGNISIANGTTIRFTGNADSYSVSAGTTAVYSGANSYYPGSYCNSYYCPNGGDVSGTTCTGYTMDVTGHCDCAQSGSTWYAAGNCTSEYLYAPLGYSAGTAIAVESDPSHYYEQPDQARAINYACSVLKKSPVATYGHYYWNGDYPASCASSGTYSCNSNEYSDGNKCYYCNTGSINGTSCVTYEPVYETRYRYNYTISYYV